MAWDNREQISHTDESLYELFKSGGGRDFKVQNLNMSTNDELKNQTANGTKPVLPAVVPNATLCSVCYNPHRLRDEEAGSQREIKRLCKKCYDVKYNGS